MPIYSRRSFLIHLSVTLSLCALRDRSASAYAAAPVAKSAIDGLEGDWHPVGRLRSAATADGVLLEDGFAMSGAKIGDGAFTFQARAPQGAEQVQIWAAIRCRDRDSRYVFALRGGNNDDVYMARYAPDGGAKFLGIAPLDFHPEVGTWYTLRAVAQGNRFQVFVGEEKLPRIDVVDADASWTEGGVALGGGCLPVEFRPLTGRALTSAESAAMGAAGSAVWMPAPVDKAALRARQRAAFRGVKVAALGSVRDTVALDGDWLFLPDQQLQEGVTAPQAAEFDDSAWHVLPVPNFWTPTLSWLHGESGFNYLTGVSAGKGVSDRLLESELRRLNGYTFPWRDTHGGWYRQVIDLPANPADIAGRHFALCFDAIAKVSTVWVNGTKVGSHVGMFGEVVCDATAAMRPGRNVVAVHVAARADNHKPAANPNAVVGVAVTVEVTDAMLNSLPHGMYPDNAAGIWQPVRLVVTRPSAIENVHIKPRLDGFDAEVALRKASASAHLAVSYGVRAVRDGSVLYKSPTAALIADTALTLSTPPLSPRLWSPAEPNLYHLELTLTEGGAVVDRRTETFGFRTFAAQDGKLMLNGKPFYLRGANHFPHALRPNDGALARKFMQMAKDGNVVATRSHTAPFTKTWLDAADEVGMLVSFEGTWPWLMLAGDTPAPDLLRAWKDEFAVLMRTHRNHPSLVMWTVNNEMKFESQDRKDPALLLRKWTVLSDMVKTMRATDATRPVCCDSSYTRAGIGASYDEFVKPHGFDDGDIDDSHRYYGWYNESFFHLFAPGTFAKNQHTPGRPLISQEMSTGYPRNDDGHPCRAYLFQHHTPQSLVGDDAWEHRDPALFLERQAFMTKELAEVFRRADRADCCGTLHFAYLTWFQNVWDADSIRPFTTYHALQKALQPILVSAELRGRHWYARTTHRVRVCIANDALDAADIPGARLFWDVFAAGVSFTRGSVAVPPVAYYANGWAELDLELPSDLPHPRVDAVLRLRLEAHGAVLSENDYAITLATPAWAQANVSRETSRPVALFDPNDKLAPALRRPSLTPVATLGGLHPTQALVVADADTTLHLPGVMEQVGAFVRGGGRLLLLHPGTHLPRLFPELVKSYRNCEGEIAAMGVPESPVFDGLQSLDLAWFEQGLTAIPRACRGTYTIDRTHPGATALAVVTDRHGYLKKTSDVVAISGSPLVELTVGAGRVWASEMALDAAGDDPIAGRLWGNLLGMLG